LLIAGSTRIYQAPAPPPRAACLRTVPTALRRGPKFHRHELEGRNLRDYLRSALATDGAGNACAHLLGGAPPAATTNSIASPGGASTGTWSTPVAVTFNANRKLDDKWIAVDRSASSWRPHLCRVGSKCLDEPDPASRHRAMAVRHGHRPRN
jgi:hypothetical protein